MFLAEKFVKALSKASLFCKTIMEDTYKDRGARKRLVQELRTKGIVDEKVLAAMLKIPRHFFIQSEFRSHAYQDKAFKIDAGQTISQPYTVAYQTQLLQIEAGDKVLEVGTGSAYQAIILLELGVNLFTIERQEELFKKAHVRISKFGYKATCIFGDGSKGYEAAAPYDKIIVTAGAPVLPESLISQLKIGGILIIPIGDSKIQKMHSIVKTSATTYEEITLENFKFVPLIGEQAW
jgi:protein-L-isoaspartate(D-aspartate) O-methyltransferase